jgi:hypothetical protein
MGCTKCYPCVEERLLAALDDCTEEVRSEAAKALRRTATENCRCCRYTSCCSQKVFDKLNKVAFDTRDDGCPVEPSARVRRMARQALEMCGSPTSAPQEPTPEEGPTGAMPPGPLPPPEEPPAEAPPAQAPAAGAPAADAPPASAAATPTAAAPTTAPAQASAPPVAATANKPASVAPPRGAAVPAAATPPAELPEKSADAAAPNGQPAGTPAPASAAKTTKPANIKILAEPPAQNPIIITDRSAEDAPAPRSPQVR